MMRGEGEGGDGRRDEGYRKGESRIVLHSAKSEMRRRGMNKRNKRAVRSIVVVKTS